MKNPGIGVGIRTERPPTIPTARHLDCAAIFGSHLNVHITSRFPEPAPRFVLDLPCFYAKCQKKRNEEAMQKKAAVEFLFEVTNRI